MNSNLESLAQGTGAALLMVPAAASMAYAATRDLLRRRNAPSVQDSALQPELGSALGEIETLLDAIQVTIENSIAQQAPQSLSERAVANAGQEINEITESIHGVIDEVKSRADPRAANANSAEDPRIPFPVALRELAMFGGRKRARIFVSTGATFDASGMAYTIKIVGNRGSQQLTFASGTRRNDFVIAFNQFHSATGVAAIRAGTDLVRLISLRKGPHQFVGAKMISGNRHDIIKDENQANGSDRQLDFGE